MNVPAIADRNEIMEAVLIKGDLSKLTPDERNRYYLETCQSLGLNPLTKPFDYITLNGKMTLYAKRDCADQLRKLNGVNIEILDKTIEGQLFMVTVRATDKSGRQDEDMGVVVLPQGGAGEIRANAMLKAITKAKRRVTLSICGLGFLDETEVEDIPKAENPRRAVQVVRPGPKPIAVPEKAVVDAETGEILASASGDAKQAAPSDSQSPDETADGAAMPIEDMAREAAMRGREAFDFFYKACSRDEKLAVRAIKSELEQLFPVE